MEKSNPWDLNIVLGIDPSMTNTGYVVLGGPPREPEVLVAGAISSAPYLRPPRLQNMRASLRDTVIEWKPKVIAMEAEVWMSNPSASTDQSAVQAIYQDMLYTEMAGTLNLDWKVAPPRFRFLSVNASQVKKYVGAPKKEHILKEVWRRYEFDTNVNDIADAYVVARIAWDLIHRTPSELIKPQAEVFAKLVASGFVWESRTAVPVQMRRTKKSK